MFLKVRGLFWSEELGLSLLLLLEESSPEQLGVVVVVVVMVVVFVVMEDQRSEKQKGLLKPALLPQPSLATDNDEIDSQNSKMKIKKQDQIVAMKTDFLSKQNKMSQTIRISIASHEVPSVHRRRDCGHEEGLSRKRAIQRAVIESPKFVIKHTVVMKMLIKERHSSILDMKQSIKRKHQRTVHAAACR